MKRNLLAILVLITLSFTTLLAQPILTASGINPVAGDHYIGQRVISSSIPLITTGGANQTWDFSKLENDNTPFNTTIYHFTSPNGLPGSSQFSNASLATYQNVDSSYSYWLTNNSTFGWLGNVNKNGTVDIKYAPCQLLAHYPFSFNSVFIDTERATSNFNPSYYSLYNDTLTGDAYGTLKMPFATYSNVLRVKIIKKETRYNNGTVSIGGISSTEYYYFANGSHLPLLALYQSSFDTSGIYFTNTTTTPLTVFNLKVFWQKERPTVQWLAENTINTKAFNILRSTNGADFVKVAVVPVGADTKMYTYTDPNTINNTVYYRIEQVDKNGELFYSSIVSLQPAFAQVNYKAFPNPANNQVAISVPSGSAQSVRIYALGGKLVYSNPSYQANQMIGISQWAKGQYFVHIQTETGVQISSFEKQ